MDPILVLYDQVPAAIEGELAAKRTAGHGISVMKSFGRDVVPRGKEGQFPYLIVASPNIAQTGESSEATYFRVEQDVTIFDRTQNDLQGYSATLMDALAGLLNSPEAFSAALPDGFSAYSIRPPLANGRRLQDGLHALRLSIRFEARVERKD